MNPHLKRATLLYEQSRYDLADQEARQALLIDPNDALAHALLAMCLAQRERYDEATREAVAAVRLEPDHPHVHYTMAFIFFHRHRYNEAQAAIEQAIRFDPEDADYHALEAGIRYSRKDWAGSRAAAERGLAFDAEHIQCNNFRAMALIQLGEREQAGKTIDAALARDPDNPITHANRGWALLDRGEPQAAMAHFREALRLDPHLEWARHGILEAMKARSTIYRWMLRYFLWIAKLSGKAAWLFIIGLWAGNVLAIRIAGLYPAAAPYVWPLIGCYLGFVLTSWLSTPLFNLVLCTSRFGRQALTRLEILFSSLVGATLAASLACLCLWVFASDPNVAFAAKQSAILLAFFTIPLRGIAICTPGWPRKIMSIYTIGIGSAGALAIGLLLHGLSHDTQITETQFALFDWGSTICAWGSVLSTWGINIIGKIIPKK